MYVFFKIYPHTHGVAWDSRMPTQPVEVYPVQRHLKKHLTVLYESELLFDDFKLTISSNDRYVSG